MAYFLNYRPQNLRQIPHVFKQSLLLATNITQMRSRILP